MEFVFDDTGIATLSQDRTMRRRSLDLFDECKYAPSKTLLGHKNFVSLFMWIPPNGKFQIGRMDMLVLVWDLGTEEKVQMLKGHKLQACGNLSYIELALQLHGLMENFDFGSNAYMAIQNSIMDMIISMEK